MRSERLSPFNKLSGPSISTNDTKPSSTEGTPEIDFGPAADARMLSLLDAGAKPLGTTQFTGFNGIFGCPKPVVNSSEVATETRQKMIGIYEGLLEPKFEVVTEKEKAARLKKGTLAPNTITKAELTELAALMTDIRLGNTMIEIHSNGDEKAFKAAVLDDLTEILRTAEGRSLVKELATAKHAVTINDLGAPGKSELLFPYGKAGEKPEAVADRGQTRWLPEGVSLADAESMSETDLAKKMYAAEPELSNGKGLPSVVTYLPGVDASFSGKVPKGEVVMDFAKANPSHAVLFHELLHGLHNARGDRPLAKELGFDGDGRGAKAVELQVTGVGNSLMGDAYADPTPGVFEKDEAPVESDYRAERKALGDKKTLERKQYAPTGAP